MMPTPRQQMKGQRYLDWLSKFQLEIALKEMHVSIQGYVHIIKIR